MKKMSRKLIKGTNWALAGLLTTIGFSSCEKTKDMPAEYGTPHASYTVKGKVTDEAGKGLDSIRVTIPSMELVTNTTSTFIPDHPYAKVPVNDTLYTQNDGSFECKFEQFPLDTLKLNFKFEDISDNQRIESDSVTVAFPSSDLSGGEGWYAGEATQEITVKLKTKK